MNYTITNIASPSTFLSAAEGSSSIYCAKMMLTGPDIAITVTSEDIQTFVDSVAVTDGDPLSFVADHEERIIAATMPLLGDFTRVTILGRWAVVQGTGWIEPYAVELIDPSGTAKLRGYDLKIFPYDDTPKIGREAHFADENTEQVMSVLMSIAENLLRFDETAEIRSKGWPAGLFWFSDDQKACLAYQAIGQKAFSDTRYARIAEEMVGSLGQPIKRGTPPRNERVGTM